MEFSEKVTRVTLQIHNLRSRTATITISVPKKDMVRSDTITADPKSIEIKAVSHRDQPIEGHTYPLPSEPPANLTWSSLQPTRAGPSPIPIW